MENDIVIYTTGYLATRLVILIGFGYALYYVMRPRRVTVGSAAGGYPRAARRADAVFDDRC